MLAKGYGCEGRTITDSNELEDAIKFGLEYEGGPYVLQVKVDPSSPPLLS
jgi:thiamine pyrophosphate-dependent acetolactate synthase large subunit-like protein